ncbi:MAG TPA: tetratricopeptide repeat protein [Saprospiraceae bacterium]|nr:tetratricopeptide repeat protein [Saprospiraceae bacterium]
MRRLIALEVLEQDSAILKTLHVYKKNFPESALFKSLNNYYQAIFTQYTGKFDSADMHYIEAIKGFQNLQQKQYQAKAMDQYGGSLTTQGKTNEAIDIKFKALELAKSIGDTSLAMQIQLHLANSFNLKGDFDHVLELLNEPQAYFNDKQDYDKLAYILAMKGTSLISKKEFEPALTYHIDALALRRKNPLSPGYTESLYHVGRALGKLERWQESLDTLRVAERALANGSDKQGQAFIYSGIGEALFNLGKFNEAEKYILTSLQTSLKRKQYPASALASGRLSKIRKAQHNFEEALQYHEQFVSLKDSVFNQEKQKIGKELAVKYEAKEKEAQIAALQREQKLAFQRNLGIIGMILSISLLGLYIYQLYMQRERQRIEAERMRAAALAQELQHQLQQQQQLLDYHKQQLNDFTQLLAEKNNILVQLSQELEKNKNNLNTETDLLYNQVILTDSDWEKFQVYFNKVHPGFISALRQRQPDLTPAEIRLILLDKLGLSLKETSAILGISLDAVKKGRYRLKKKYQLDGDNLERI